MGRETGKIPATAFRAASCNSLSEYVDAPSEDVKRFFWFYVGWNEAGASFGKLSFGRNGNNEVLFIVSLFDETRGIFRGGRGGRHGELCWVKSLMRL